jgi:hypothetical protein
MIVINHASSVILTIFMCMSSSGKTGITLLAVISNEWLCTNTLSFRAKLRFSERIAMSYRIMLILFFSLEAIISLLLHWFNHLMAL